VDIENQLRIFTYNEQIPEESPSKDKRVVCASSNGKSKSAIRDFSFDLNSSNNVFKGIFY